MKIRVSSRAEIAPKSIVRDAEIKHPVITVLINDDWSLGIGIYEKSSDMEKDELLSVRSLVFLLGESQATYLDGRTIEKVGGGFVAIDTKRSFTELS